MSLLTIIVGLVIIGVILWLINTFIPMDQRIKTILNVLIILIVIIWLLQAFGVITYLNRPIAR
jgi:hypothetical protein